MKGIQKVHTYKMKLKENFSKLRNRYVFHSMGNH